MNKNQNQPQNNPNRKNEKNQDEVITVQGGKAKANKEHQGNTGKQTGKDGAVLKDLNNGTKKETK